jgi:large subunit ribosomal protein L23
MSKLGIGIAGERLHRIVLAPIVSEKSTRVSEKHNQAVFRVVRDARKPEIKAAVEKLFNVKVEAVRTLRVKGKTRRFGATPGVRSDWKKAYVTLAQGQQIDFVGGGSAA